MIAYSTAWARKVSSAIVGTRADARAGSELRRRVGLDAVVHELDARPVGERRPRDEAQGAQGDPAIAHRQSGAPEQRQQHQRRVGRPPAAINPIDSAPANSAAGPPRRISASAECGARDHQPSWATEPNIANAIGI